ncbi:MAG: hypothetical protein V5B78_10680, partial [Desulfohalobiaceae bacterium]
MRKVLALMSAMALVLCFATGASAVDVEVGGSLTVVGGAADNDFTEGYGPNGLGRSQSEDGGFEMARWMTLDTNFIWSENLKAVVDWQLGDAASGGFFGADDNLPGGESDGDAAVELDKMYLDFVVPNTETRFRMGSQSFALPGSPLTAGQLLTET